MKRILIIILFFLFNISFSNDNDDVLSDLYIEGTGFTCTFKNKAIVLVDKQEHTHYVINLTKDKVILDTSINDLDSDGTDEILVISAREGEMYGSDFIIFSPVYDEESIVINEIYRKDFSMVKPWEIQVCDIDGDSIKDIFVGVYKSTPMFKNVENRPFFFNWDGEKLTKKWAGSKLDHPFESVAFADLMGDQADEFIVVEKLENHEEIIAIYYWFGFGFVKFAESKQYNNIDEVRILNRQGKLSLQVNLNDANNIILNLEGNQLIEGNQE